MTLTEKRIEQLEDIKEEEDMQVRQGKNIITVGIRTFARMKEDQFATALKEKEEKYKRLLKEEKDELQRKLQDQLHINDLEHKVALQEKELKIKELKQTNAKMRQETTPHPPPQHDQTFGRDIHNIILGAYHYHILVHQFLPKSLLSYIRAAASH